MTAAQKPARRRAPRGSGEQLRAEIITAVKDLLVEGSSVEAISIRAVAQRVGVTAPSIYRHFADRNALLDAVVSDVFEDLDAAMAVAVADVASPLDRCARLGMAYIHWALEHREQYRIAVMEPCIEPPSVDEIIRDGAFTRLLTTVQECIDAGIFAGEPLPIALDLWSAAHGLASLVIAKPYLPWGDVSEMALRVLASAAIGHAVIDRIGSLEIADAVTWLRSH
jgi:AcrR family transcriptional regulator